jgi:hypothetical protein
MISIQKQLYGILALLTIICFLMGLVLGNIVPIVPPTDLSSYMKTDEFSGYIKSSDLSEYVSMDNLDKYLASDVFNDYVERIGDIKPVRNVLSADLFDLINERNYLFTTPKFVAEYATIASHSTEAQNADYFVTATEKGGKEYIHMIIERIEGVDDLVQSVLTKVVMSIDDRII